MAETFGAGGLGPGWAWVPGSHPRDRDPERVRRTEAAIRRMIGAPPLSAQEARREALAYDFPSDQVARAVGLPEGSPVAWKTGETATGMRLAVRIRGRTFVADVPDIEVEDADLDLFPLILKRLVEVSDG